LKKLKIAWCAGAFLSLFCCESFILPLHFTLFNYKEQKTNKTIIFQFHEEEEKQQIHI